MGASQSKDELSEASAAEYQKVQKLIEEKGVEAVQQQMSEKLESWKKKEIKHCVTGMGELENHTLSMPFEGMSSCRSF